jgi:hypothetical protein
MENAPWRPIPANPKFAKKIGKYFGDLVEADLLKYRIPEVKNPTVETAIKMIANKRSHNFFMQDTNTGDFVGEFMTADFRGLAAAIHFSTHPSLWGRNSIAAAKAAIDWLFSLTSQKPYSRPYVKTLIGLTPVSNRLAVRFLKKVGFEIKTIIPDSYYLAYDNKYDDAVLSLKTSDSQNIRG